MILKTIHNIKRTRGGRLPEAATKINANAVTVPNDVEHDAPYLFEKVRSMDLKPETARAGGEYIHGSSLIGMCARKEALASLSTSRQASPNPPDRILWALGRAAEKHVRDQFIKAVNRKGVIGRWTCRHAGEAGHEYVDGFFPENVSCSACREPLDQYGELTLWDHDNKIVGNPDLLYIRGDNSKLRVVEIKSMNVTDFKQLAGPLMDHVSQAMIYRRLAQLNGWDVDDGVTVFYVCKDYAWKPYKEFHVQTSDIIEQSLDGMWVKAQEVNNWKISRTPDYSPTLPDRVPLCPSRDATHAKKCAECNACFAHG